MEHKKIILDIGHGIDTIGKGVPELKEFNFNQAVVKYATELAKINNINVILTQPFDGKEVPLSERTRIANSSNAKLLISIHADYSANKNINGHWAFYWHNKLESKKLAEIWNKYAKDILPNPNRGICPSEPNFWTNFHMVREIKTMPSILVEHGFMSNIEDLKLLKTEEFRKLCAEVIIRTVCEYLDIPFKEDKSMHKDIDGHWAKESIERILKNEIMGGYEDGTFKPDKPLTRAELAVVVDRILQKQCWYKG